MIDTGIRTGGPASLIWDAISWPNSRRRLEITLCLSHGCALACAYCYRPHTGDRTSPIMPREVAARAIDYFLSEYPVESEAYSIACENPDHQAYL